MIGLQRFGRRVRPASVRNALESSGIDGTLTRCVLSVTTIRFLSRRYPGTVRFDRSALGSADTLTPLLRRTMLRAEEDGFDTQSISTREWMQRAMGSGSTTMLDWLLDQRPARGAAAREWDTAFDEIEPQIIWTPPPEASATHLRMPFDPSAFRSGFRRPLSPKGLTKTLDEITLLDPVPAQEAIDVARLALATRGREVHAITEANPAEVYLADLGEGVALVLIGADPHARMSLEANYGYLLVANGVPIGYGGVTPLAHQANTGINIFPSFRQSEASAIFSRTLQAFTTLFNVRRFIVNPYQFGRDNPEAISSGAYWFYHRLGFEATDPALRALAQREAGRQHRKKGYRTDRTTLRHLATGDLILTLPGAGRHRFLEEQLLEQWGLLASSAIGKLARGRRRTTVYREIIRDTARRIGVTNRRGWSRQQRDGFDQLTPVVAMLPLERWSAQERSALVDAMRAKGASQERTFVQASQRVPRLWRDLVRLAQKGEEA